MDKSVKKLCAMLQSPDGMRRCAAAMVLTELAPKDVAVVKALGAALGPANQMLTRYILEAFESIGTRAVVPHVLPLLEVDDTETKLRAAAIIARVGGEMVHELKRQFMLASPQQKRVLVEILARIQGRESLQIVLETLFDPDAELARESCEAVRRHIGEASPKERLAMHRQVVKFMSTARARKDERVVTSCVLLIGYIGAPPSRQILLKHAAPRNPNLMRRNALLGLKSQAALSGAAATQLANHLLKYLDDSDWQNIAQHALDIIEHLTLPRSFEQRWRRLLDNKHASIRSFAARRIASTDNATSNALLMKLLQHEDLHVSEIAAGALARHKGATKLLLAALARERKSEPAWRLAKILKPHGESIDKKTIRKFATLATRELEAGQPRHEALLYFLRNLDPNTADQVVRNAGLKFKKARKWNRAVDCLRSLARNDGTDIELRYELSLCNLKLSPKDLSAHLRAEDPALRGFQALLQDNKFNLPARLAKERALQAEDLFYCGFHFSEGSGEEQSFGHRLLEQVAKKWPRTKAGKAARQKLKLTAAG